MLQTNPSEPSWGGADTDQAAYRNNISLSRSEYVQQHIYLRSYPRYLTLVLGNGCNISCIHCYQAKNGDNLLKPAEIGRELRREVMGFYPYLSTLRVQGGEVFAMPGFRDLIGDLAACVRRPILSVSTNGTLIDDQWAETIVRLPFANLTFSLDAGTAATFARIRRGANFDAVLGNIRRVQQWKQKLGSALPALDSFFAIMRSNFREIPRFLEVIADHGFYGACLQTLFINRENTSRVPTFLADELITEASEVRELHALLRDVLPKARARFSMIRTMGLTALFQHHGLDASFVHEDTEGVYPDGDNVAGVPGKQATPQMLPEAVPEPRVCAAVSSAQPEVCAAVPSARPEACAPLCPNPWNTLFVAESGDVQLCFLADRIGNLYETPLAGIWNSPAALAKRSQMISGRYTVSGCSPFCEWRDGKQAALASGEDLAAARAQFRELADRAAAGAPRPGLDADLPSLAAVRRVLAARDQRIRELESMFAQFSEADSTVHQQGQRHIEHLESVRQNQQRHIDHLESVRREAERHIDRMENIRRWPLVRVAEKVTNAWARLRRPR